MNDDLEQYEEDSLATYLEDPSAENFVAAAENYEVEELEEVDHKLDLMQALAVSYDDFNTRLETGSYEQE